MRGNVTGARLFRLTISMSLAQHIDRVARNARSVAEHAADVAPAAPAAGPFTRAMLYTDLGDLIRDVDRAELGLFNLSGRPSKDPATTRVTRADFVGATPLRKQPAPKTKRDDPESYIQAALKCIVR